LIKTAGTVLIGREFHGFWGDFDVKLTLDKEYTIGGKYLYSKLLKK
jgi:hypothetical protein